MAKSVYANRGEVFSRFMIAVPGGYALAALASVVTPLLLPDGGRAVQGLGQIIGFSLFGLAVILAFSVSSARRAWIAVGVPLVLLTICFAIVSGGGA